jgi:putative ABC transport system permease protein
VGAGDTLVARLARTLNGRQEVEPLTLKVLAVAPPEAFSREGAFVTLAFAVMVEDFQDGIALAPPSASALPETQRAQFAGFRLYADRLESVPVLDGYLRETEHVDVLSRVTSLA